MKDFNEPVLVMDGDGIHVVGEGEAETLEKKNLSASLITGIEQCPARWAADTLVVRDLIEQEPDNAASRGVLFHKVMEVFFALEPAERTKPKLNEIVNEILTSDEFKDWALTKDVKTWLVTAIRNYYNMGARPDGVNIATIKSDSGADKIGLEVFVKGKVGAAKRDTLGFIDRLVEDKNGQLIIEDWKTGSKAKVWKSHTKSLDGFAEQRQQLIYKTLLEKMGYTVRGARLIYPVARTIVPVNIKDTDLMNKVIDSVNQADDALTTMIETNTFDAKPSFLCAWCPLAKICPKAQIKPYQKMQDAYSAQPEPSELMKAIDVR